MTYLSENQLDFGFEYLDIEDEVNLVVEDGKGADMDIPEFPILRCNEKQALESYESLLAYDFTNLIAKETWSSRQTVIDPEFQKDILHHDQNILFPKIHFPFYRYVLKIQ